jgi:hypothetical protein
MSFPFAVRFIKLVLIFSAGTLMGCHRWRTVHVLSFAQGQALSEKYVRHYNPHRKQSKWLGPAATFTRFRRTNSTDAPIITGYVAILEPNGKFTPLPGGFITIDKAHIFADKDGNYMQIIATGRHRVRGGGVGFLYSEAPSLHAEPGDSIRLIFQLLPEFRPTIN